MKFKKLTAIILCFVLCALLCPAVSAATPPKIIITNAAAFPEETTSVTISLNNNPGLSGMAFSVTYNKDYFEFVSFSKGIISTPYFKDHADQGFVAFSVSETSDLKTNGTMLTINFKVKSGAPIGTYPIGIADSYGKPLSSKSFCSSNGDEYKPDVQSGSIRVKGQCDISGHDYTEWTEIRPANCTEFGEKQRICNVCNTVDTANIPYAHDFEADWTVDKAATPEEDGVMSRHCTLCDEVTDIIVFRYDEIGGDDDDTSSDDTSSDSTTSDDTSSDDTTTESTPSDDTSSTDKEEDKKPNIDNVEGEKVPSSEAEKFEDYKEPQPDQEYDGTDDVVDNSTDDTSSAPDDTTSKEAVASTNADTTDEEKPFLKTPMGIITVVICIIFSFGIVALAILLIKKNKKNAE